MIDAKTAEKKPRFIAIKWYNAYLVRIATVKIVEIKIVMFVDKRLKYLI